MDTTNKIQLKNQLVEIKKCKYCDGLMVNLDADQLALGDLVIIKKAGVKISNPNTDKAVCISCEYKTFGSKVAEWFDKDDDDDDSSFFGSCGFLGGSSGGGFGGFSGGFGGFGGGGFGGAGASRGF